MRIPISVLVALVASTVGAQTPDQAKRAAECPPCAEWNLPQAPGTKVPARPRARQSAEPAKARPCPATMTWPGMGDFRLG